MKCLHKCNRLNKAYPDHSFKHCSLPQNKWNMSLPLSNFSSYYLWLSNINLLTMFIAWWLLLEWKLHEDKNFWNLLCLLPQCLEQNLDYSCCSIHFFFLRYESNNNLEFSSSCLPRSLQFTLDFSLLLAWEAMSSKL